VFLHTLRVFCFPPTFTMMHLCITQCTYWTPLLRGALSPATAKEPKGLKKPAERRHIVPGQQAQGKG